ncbi:MAG: PAS domain-containing protein, partial [Leptospiraceae bacterium]|nr:PAS domain-containing protein [Leptospiraceae bacterium]
MKDTKFKEDDLYRILINNTDDFIYSFNLDGHYTAVNHSFCEAFKKNKSEIIGKHYSDLISSEKILDEWQRNINKVYSNQKTIQFELSMDMSDGLVHYYDIKLLPIMNKSGNIIGIHGTNRDITKRYLAL